MSINQDRLRVEDESEPIFNKYRFLRQTLYSMLYLAQDISRSDNVLDMTDIINTIEVQISTTDIILNNKVNWMSRRLKELIDDEDSCS